MATLRSWFRRLPDKSGYLLILPFYLIFMIFWFTPVLEVIRYSFTDYSIFKEYGFVGLENYKALFTDATFIKAIINTLTYTVGTLFPVMFLGFVAAYLMNTKGLRTKLARTILFAPHVTGMAAMSMVWLLIYDPNFGYMNHILEAVGLPSLQWLKSTNTAMLGVILMSIWKGIGYNMIINLSGLQSIPETYYEVALIEGANLFQKIRYIVLPTLAPTTFLLFVTGIINSFNVFEQVNVLTNGGPANSTTTIVHQIYTNGFTYYKMGYASAQSVILLVVVSIVTLLNFRFGSGNAD